VTRFERWSVWSTSIATIGTGVGLVWAKYFVTSADPWAVINHPLEPWLLKTHIIVAPLLVFSIGLIATRHIWRHLRSPTPWGRKSGIVTLATLAPMIGTGYLIQVVTLQGWLQVLAVAHILLGLLYAIGLALHWPRVRARRSSARRQPSASRSVELDLPLTGGRR
jgi:uncharacterized membrane protein YidH (DUF202 family)